MLAEYFASPIRIEEIRGCPAGQMLEGFTRELHQAGMRNSRLAGICARQSTSFIGLAEKACPFQPWKSALSRSFPSI
jgi:hypothetical protein